MFAISTLVLMDLFSLPVLQDDITIKGTVISRGAHNNQQGLGEGKNNN